MKFRLASDLHTEFFEGNEYRIPQIAEQMLPSLPYDKTTSLILAGDIGSMYAPEALIAFIDQVAPRFEDVAYVPGNHEFYGGDLEETVSRLSKDLSKHENLFITDRGGYFTTTARRVLMFTLWTDFDKENPISMSEARLGMNDYQFIKCGGRLARPEDMIHIHKCSVEALQTIKEGDIVITHHAPSYQSVPENYKTSRVNGAYASDLEQLILDKKPSVWCHGHTHIACDYMIGSTRVICNPRGYGNQHKNNGYNPTLVFEV